MLIAIIHINTFHIALVSFINTNAVPLLHRTQSKHKLTSDNTLLTPATVKNLDSDG